MEEADMIGMDEPLEGWPCSAGFAPRAVVNLPVRPAHWLPGEPAVWQMPETADGFAELNLELGGRVVATRVACDQPSCERALADFHGLIRADLEASQP